MRRNSCHFSAGTASVRKVRGRRESARRDMTNSTTARVLAPGVWTTRMPRWRQAARSMFPRATTARPKTFEGGARFVVIAPELGGLDDGGHGPSAPLDQFILAVSQDLVALEFGALLVGGEADGATILVHGLGDLLGPLGGVREEFLHHADDVLVG